LPLYSGGPGRTLGISRHTETTIAYVFAVEDVSLRLLLFGMACEGQIDGRHVLLVRVCPWESDAFGGRGSAAKHVDVDAANVILASSKRAGRGAGISISVAVQGDDFRAEYVGAGFDVARDLNRVRVTVVRGYDIGPFPCDR
jgi:hypothetical protein